MAGGAFASQGDRKWRRRGCGGAGPTPRPTRRCRGSFARARPPAGQLPSAGADSSPRWSSPRTRQVSPMWVSRCWVRRRRCRSLPAGEGFLPGDLWRTRLQRCVSGTAHPCRANSKSPVWGSTDPWHSSSVNRTQQPRALSEERVSGHQSQALDICQEDTKAKLWRCVLGTGPS